MENKIVKGKIESIKPLNSGTSYKDGRTINWTRFEVIINGDRFTSFDKGLNVGQEIEMEYKEEQRTSQRGTQYVSKTLISPKKGDNYVFLMKQLAEIITKLGKIEGLIYELRGSGIRDLSAPVNADKQPNSPDLEEFDLPDLEIIGEESHN